MARPAFGDRVRYAFDNWMARGPAALMLLLGLITLAFVTVLGTITWAVVHAIGDEDNFERDDGMGPLDFIWRSLMRTLATEEGDTGWIFRLLMLIVSIGGLLIGATLIGIVSGAFAERVDELRKGRSRVLESDHTLVLGWSGKVFAIVRELATANLSRGRSAIVILADRDKVEMEDDIKAQVGDTGTTRVIVRSGDPMNLAELEIASPETARSIIVLAPEDDDDPDATVIKTTLALTRDSDGESGHRYHIVGELQDPANLEVARLVGRTHAHWVLGADLISRITVQTCRQSGLSAVYSELLDFAGCEIYTSRQDALVGRTYREAQHSFDASAVMGLVQDGVVRLNPDGDTVIGAGDELIVIAEDDDAIELTQPGIPRPEAISTEEPPAPRTESTLVLGWNARLGLMLGELDGYATPRSRVTVIADVDQPDFGDLVNIDVTFQRGDPTCRPVLEQAYIHRVDHIIVLASDTLPAQRADARTLITLLHLRDIAQRKGATLNVVSEMLDDRNRELAEVTGADDFIVSDKLISLFLSQLSENPVLTEVFRELFSADGAEIYLRPANLYVAPGESVDFHTVVEAAGRRGETAIGYRIVANSRDPQQSYGVRLNPVKSEEIAFAPGDQVVVLASD